MSYRKGKGRGSWFFFLFNYERVIREEREKLDLVLGAELKMRV